MNYSPLQQEMAAKILSGNITNADNFFREYSLFDKREYNVVINRKKINNPKVIANHSYAKNYVALFDEVVNNLLELKFISLLERDIIEVPYQFVYKIHNNDKITFHFANKFYEIIHKYYYNDIEISNRRNFDHFVNKYKCMTQQNFYQFKYNKRSSRFILFTAIMMIITLIVNILIELYTTKDVNIVTNLNNQNAVTEKIQEESSGNFIQDSLIYKEDQSKLK